MTGNRLARSTNADTIEGPKPGSTLAEREQFWVDRGNRVLWGEEATSKGDFLPPRRDLEWRCDNGHFYIAPVGNGRNLRSGAE